MPGDPTPRAPLVPGAVADLAAAQQGENIVLTFTLPARTVDDRALEQPPDIEVFRWFLPAGAAPDPDTLPEKPLLTIPSALVDTMLEAGRVRFTDRLPPGELDRRAGQQAAYAVRARVSRQRPAAASNIAAARIFPVPEPPAGLAATITESAVELRWTPPARTTGGARIPSLAGYRVYRAEPPGAPVLVAAAPSAFYRDTQFEVGRIYAYAVTAVAQYEAESVESALSAPVEVAPRDTFPPAPPENLVVVAVPATAESPAALELSWSIGAEADLAGWIVYRSESEGAPGARLNPELLPAPAFRDTQVAPGRRYFYTVTAVDRAGNESAPGAAVSETVPEGNSPR